MTGMELMAPLTFGLMVLLLLSGFPVGLALLGHGFLFLGIGILSGHFPAAFAYNEVLRVYGFTANDMLLAIPFFTLMGTVLERSGIAQDLLASVGELLGAVRGGLAYAVILVGTLLAATTGVIQASIIAMGVISLPTMLSRGYQQALSCGVITAAGTLAQLIPPSLVLIVMADATGISVVQMYERALAPGLILMAAYFLYVGVRVRLNPALAPALQSRVPRGAARRALVALVPPLVLIGGTLGSMLAGLATPTESGAFGAVAALALAAVRRRLSRSMLRECVDTTLLTSCCALFILIGANAFMLPFKGMDGNLWIEGWFAALPGGTTGFLLAVNALVFVLAFFLDFFEIAFVVMPLLMPMVLRLGIDPAWFAVLVCVALQTSFMHPPFGVALYSLRSVAPPSVGTGAIYRGALPFIGLLLAVVALLIWQPRLVVHLQEPAPPPMAPAAVDALLHSLPHPDVQAVERVPPRAP